jgi:fructoselysine 6-kinase
MKILCVGDCGVDRYLNLGGDRPGGITLNFAVNIRKCLPADDSVGVVTAVGTDPESKIVVDAIERLGLEAHLTRLEGQTSIQYIDREPSGEKIFVRYEQGVLGDYRVGESERRAIADSDVLVAVVYAQIVGFFDSVMAAPSSGLRAVDFGDLSDFNDRMEIVTRYLDRFHLGFFGLKAAEIELIDRLERLAQRNNKLFVVTLGAEGSMALGGRKRIECRAVSVSEVVETTGAGDVFAAGFVSEYCRAKDVRKSLEKGSEKAARSLGRVGAFEAEMLVRLDRRP